MSLRPPEDLLARLVAEPQGSVASGDADRAAAAELVHRGHALVAGAAGWRLECAALHFDPRAFAAARRGDLGAALEVWERAVSTNDLAHAGAARGAPDGAAWLAEEQTGGRGRQGRTWSCAPHAGLLVSWLARGALADARRPTLLPLVLGLGVCDGLRGATGLDVRPKWPNDLWVGGRKVAGLLVEARAGATPYVVVGLGLNVRRAAVAEVVLPHATSLEEAGARVRREPLLAAILLAVETRLGAWRRSGDAAVLRDWLGLDVTIGRSVRVQTANGVLEGRVTGVTEDGLLRLDTAAGTRHELAAGEVHLS